MRTSVRTSTRVASPYLRAHIDDLMGPVMHVNGSGVWSAKDVLDLGCGSGRNSEYLRGLGFYVTPLDMKDDYGIRCILGVDKLPVVNNPRLKIVGLYRLPRYNRQVGGCPC